jgi:hypothetical protein
MRSLTVVLTTGAAAAAASAGFAFTIRPWWRTWGLDPEVSAAPLPGDDLVLDATTVDTRAIDIAAPPAAVWPWLVQMGDTRAGLYSYSVMGFPHGRGATTIVPEWQHLAESDVLNEWVVREIEPERALVLASDRMGRWSWVFVLEPLDEGARTRLIERWKGKATGGPRGMGVLLSAFDFGEFLMIRKQMLGIRDRAEHSTAVEPAGTGSTPTSGASTQAVRPKRLA